jgi:hypothetical protein
MPKLGLGLSLPDTRIVSAPAPSGIPVASTASVIIGDAGTFNGTYAKKIPSETVLLSAGEDAFMSAGVSYARVVGDQARVLLRPNSTIQHIIFGTILGTPYANWVALFFYFDTDTGEYYYETTYTNASTDATNIPTTGWSSAITITAA